MELPAYHLPSAKNVLRATSDRALDFVKRAGTVILLASLAIWFLSTFGIDEAGFGMVDSQENSVLAYFGRAVARIFAPLGFGQWQMVVATFMGLLAKEQVVGTLGVLYGIGGNALDLVESGSYAGFGVLATDLTALGAFAFLVFNLLCAPCFAAIGAIKKEMNSPKWTFFAITYLTLFAYIIALIINQFGLLLGGAPFSLWSGIALACFAVLLYFIFRKNPYGEDIQPQFRLKTRKETAK